MARLGSHDPAAGRVRGVVYGTLEALRGNSTVSPRTDCPQLEGAQAVEELFGGREAANKRWSQWTRRNIRKVIAPFSGAGDSS